MHVRSVRPEDTYPLRLLVLRPGGVIEDTYFASDHLEGAFHLGVFVGDDIVSVGSFHPEEHATLKDRGQYRLRGMATHPDHRNQGAGEKLMRHAFEHLRARKSSLLWCNARIKAVPFYERLGMAIEGGAFEIPGIGTHYLMHRRI